MEMTVSTHLSGTVAFHLLWDIWGVGRDCLGKLLHTAVQIPDQLPT